jgi:hypothetical protein
MIRNAEMWDAYKSLKVAAVRFADMGHHDESGTREYMVLEQVAKSLASLYADDAVNQTRFLAACGFPV